jgi:hypothetical protein
MCKIGMHPVNFSNKRSRSGSKAQWNGKPG